VTGGQLRLFELPEPVWAIRVRCLDCREDTIELDEYYMLRDDVWLEANPARDGMLCVGCVEQRLGRALRPGDFTTCVVNDPVRGSARLRARMLTIDFDVSCEREQPAA
jgi:hypothetical protein